MCLEELIGNYFQLIQFQNKRELVRNISWNLLGVAYADTSWITQRTSRSVAILDLDEMFQPVVIVERATRRSSKRIRPRTINPVMSVRARPAIFVYHTRLYANGLANGLKIRCSVGSSPTGRISFYMAR